ncbi:hypothetical protein GCM10009716_27830 [Streptomyces sodiiphilus]|uniref:Putative regulatory protein FmdB zinc ribbon domain-containing protein n=1 Tax=Streptomyces sodiiphilus TaxID=226217 RepID=A0ABP5ALF8_9ACTN
MAIYELACATGHRFEVIQSFSAALPHCPHCGGTTRKVPSTFGIGGVAAVPPPPERMPQTWKGTYRGDREYVTALQRTAEARRKLEDKHPELAGDRRPILAHEGRFEGAPLRAGDTVPSTAGPSGHHSHGHEHGHGHGHGHGQGGGDSGAGGTGTGSA